jgi:hypothetical protein
MTTDISSTRHIGRGIGVGVSIAVGTVLIVVSVLAIWLNTVAFDNATWRSTSTQIIQDPGVQKQVSHYLVGQVFSSPTVKAEITNSLPPALKLFAPEIINGARQVSETAATRLLATSQAQKLWVDASSQAHAQVVKLIEDKGQYVKTNGGKVVLDLSTVLSQVAVGPLGGVAERALPPGSGQITILQSDQLSTVQTVAQILHAVAAWIPFVTVAVFAFAVWLARGFRRRALLWSAIGILVATLILVLIRRALGEEIINSLVSDVTIRPALITAWYIGTDVLGTINATLFIIAVVLIAGLWLVSGGRYATWVRTRLAPWIANPYYAFGVPAGLLLILIVWDPLPVFHKFWSMLIIIVLAAVGIEAIRRITMAEQAEASPDAPAQTPTT